MMDAYVGTTGQGNRQFEDESKLDIATTSADSNESPVLTDV